VLDGLLLQKCDGLIWVIVTQLTLAKEHEECLERARQHGVQVLIERTERNVPLGRLANIGVRAATSAFVLLHDDDDALASNFVTPALKILQDPKYVAVACHAALIHEQETSKRLHFVLSPGRTTVDPARLVHDNVIATNAFIFRRSAFEKVDGYPEDVPVAEDWLFNQSLIKIGDIAVIPKVLSHVYLRQTPQMNKKNANTDPAEHARMATQIRQKANGGDADLEKEQRRIPNRVSRFVDRVSYRCFGLFIPRI